MGLLSLIACWVFGWDVAALGDRGYAVRAAAHARLKAVGWLAYPALERGAASAVPERASRCEELLAGLSTPWDWAETGCAAGVTPVHPDAGREFLERVCRRVDLMGGWGAGGSWAWAERTPYMRGTLAGDVAHVVRRAAVRRGLRLLAPPVPLD
jgi:hypothetical protein